MLSREDMNFLIQLQQEMLTQDHDTQAAPRYWTVGGYKNILAPEDNCDGIIIYSNRDGEMIADTIDNLIEYLKNTYGDELDDAGVKIILDEEHTNPEKGRYAYTVQQYTCEDGVPDLYTQNNITDMWELIEELTYLGILDDNEYEKRGYKREHCIYPSTFFITKRECKEHIEANHYHYEDPHTYAMTAWRAPQVERLYKILEKTDWKEVMERLYGGEDDLK